VFPLRDTAVCRRVPLAVLALIALDALAFLHELRLPPARLDPFIELFGVIPARYVHPQWAAAEGYPADWRPLLVHMFLHGGWAHLLGNLWMLKIFGDNVEDRMGPGRFLLFYLLCGGAALAAHVGMERDSVLPVVGASGAIAGVMGAYWAMFPRARVVVLVPVIVFPLILEVPAPLFLGFWFLGQLWSGSLALSSSAFEGGVAWWAHAGGFVAGLLLFPLFVRRDRWRRADPGYMEGRSGRHARGFAGAWGRRRGL
jgi:membrane associated rhomboid family serine protease